MSISTKHNLTIYKEYLFSILGGVLYAVGIRIFVAPMGLYIGTVTGIAQMIQSILNTLLNKNLDLTGPLLFIINIPLLIMTYKVINKSFFYKTFLTVAAQSLALALIPVFQKPIIGDWLTLCIIGGVVSGFGAGFTLRYGGSGGGLDILGVYLSLKYREFSVGKVSILVSSIVMIYVAVAFPAEILIYSIIFTLVYSLVLDKVHFQSIKVLVFIISNNDEIATYINQRIGRGITMWQGMGVHSKTQKNIIMALLDKFEYLNIKKELIEIDSSIFMVDTENVNVTGYFDKHFFNS